MLLYSRGKGEDQTIALSYVAFFAVFPDFLHIGDFRILSHSVIGLVGLVSAALIVLEPFGKVQRVDVLIAFVAAGSHLLADWMFGNFFPLFPFSQEYASLNYFNTLIDIRIEIVLSGVAFAAFMVLAIVGRDTRRYVRPSGKDRLTILILLLLFFALALLETGYFIQNMSSVGVTISGLILLVFFAIPLGGTVLAFRNLFKR